MKMPKTILLTAAVAPKGKLKSLQQVKKQTQKIDLSNLSDLETTLNTCNAVEYICQKEKKSKFFEKVSCLPVHVNGKG